MSKRKRLSARLNQVLSNEDQSNDDSSSFKKFHPDSTNEIEKGSFIIDKELTSDQEQDLIKSRKINCLNKDFFNTDCVTLSRNLLGKYLIRKIKHGEGNGSRLLIGKIVECEAYPGGDDKASHSYQGKVTDRTVAMFMKPGTCYVYNIYGLYCCLNVSSSESGAAVLIRAVEPLSGLNIMKSNRGPKKKSQEIKLTNLTSGPSKLCMAMQINKNEFNQIDLADSEVLWFQDCPREFSVDQSEIVSAKRVGIDSAGEEAVNKLYRFYLSDNRHVSVRTK